MEKKKVCHITSAHQAKDGRIFERECVCLAKAGYDVSLVAVNVEEEECKGVKIVNVDAEKGNRIKRFLLTTKKVRDKALGLGADVYHIHDPEMLLHALRLKKSGAKVVFDSHEFFGYQILERQYIPKCLRSVISRMYMALEAYVCRRIDVVVQVCTLQGKDYFEGRCRRSVFITNYTDFSEEQKVDVNADKERKVVHAGGLSYERGISHLVEAAAFTKAEVVLAGKFETQAYYGEVKKMDGYNNVDYVGFVKRDELLPIYARCVAGVATLLHVGQYHKIDTFPTKIYEYMRLGLPVILSDSSYNMRMNDRYGFGICVAPDKPIEIAKAIDYIIANPEEAVQMGERGRKLVEEKFNWRVESKKLVELYNYLLK